MDDKQTLRLELDVWADGRGMARVNETTLPEFLKTADTAGRGRIVRMLRQAADLVEKGLV